MPVQIFNNLGGMNNNISPFVRNQNTPEILNGCVVSHELGATTKDPGYTKKGGTVQSSKEITGLFHFQQTLNNTKMLATVNNAGDTALQLKYLNGAVWSTISVGSTWNGFEDAKVEMATGLGYCFFVGYDENDDVFLPVGSLTGTTFSTTDQVTDMPQGKYIVNYGQRIVVLNVKYGGNEYPHQAVISSIPTGSGYSWDVSGSPTQSGGGFLNVSPQEEIMGGIEAWKQLLLFTETGIYFYDRTQFNRIWEVGTSAHRSIKKHNNSVYFSNWDGIWVTRGGEPQNIGGPVVKFIKASSPRNHFATIVNEDYRLFVGNVTVDGVSYSNLEVRYHIPTQTYTLREYADQFTIYAHYSDEGKMRHYMGTANGEVMDKGEYWDTSVPSADNGTAIHSQIDFAPVFLADLQLQIGVENFVAYAKRAQGVKLRYRVLDKNHRATTPYADIGQLQDFISAFTVNNSADGVLIQVQLTEYSSKPYWSFYGFQFDVPIKGNLPK